MNRNSMNRTTFIGWVLGVAVDPVSWLEAFGALVIIQVIRLLFK
jgi:hypothetical protein